MYRWVEHTAELELAIAASSESQVFADALAALHELLAEPGNTVAELERRSIAVTAHDRPALLAAFLEELVYLAESQGFIACRLLPPGLTSDGLAAEVVGYIGAPRPLVKAVTYHGLTFRATDDGYHATVVLDV